MLIKSLKFEKKKFSTVKEVGHSNAKFYAYCILNGKRVGTVWKFNDGKYVFNEDFDRKVHSAIKRPEQIVEKTLNELKKSVRSFYEYWW